MVIKTSKTSAVKKEGKINRMNGKSTTKIINHKKLKIIGYGFQIMSKRVLPEIKGSLKTILIISRNIIESITKKINCEQLIEGLAYVRRCHRGLTWKSLQKSIMNALLVIRWITSIQYKVRTLRGFMYPGTFNI